MKGTNKKYPQQNFDFKDFGLGEGVIVAYDIQGYLAGIEYAQDNGWTLVIECNETVQIGTYLQAKIVKDVEETEVEEEIVEQTEEVSETKEESTEVEAVVDNVPVEEGDGTTSGEVGGINFEELAALENTKENRKLVDELAEKNGVELDRRKLQTVEKLVAEFEKQYAGK